MSQIEIQFFFAIDVQLVLRQRGLCQGPRVLWPQSPDCSLPFALITFTTHTDHVNRKSNMSGEVLTAVLYFGRFQIR